MFPDSPLITFEKEGSHVRAWINPSTSPFTADASEQDHKYGDLTTPLRQRGLECTVEFGLSDYIVHAELPDGSSLIISPPQETSFEHSELGEPPASWTVTRHRSVEPAVYEVVYDSEPGGPDARHGGNVQTLLAAVDERLDRLDVRQRQERSADELAAGTVLYRAGFVPAVAFGGEQYYRLPSAMTDPAEQRVVVTRAFDLLQAEGFNVICEPALLDPSLPPFRTYEMSLGDRLGHLAQAIESATHTGEVVPSLSELTAPGDGVLPRVVEILDTTAEWWEGFGDEADYRYANRLRLVAEELNSYAVELQAMRGDLADRHAVHPRKARTPADGVSPPAPSSSRVSAALASSPSAGQRTVLAGAPAEPSARTALPPARPSFSPGR
ncbi:hypothetical protein ACFWPP_11970 [Streptomyces anulatus]|uniref:hypothetical protein n=1 Tax=Streptomyces anulatus TaxID=1892 RepID=UPI0036688AE0